MGLWTRSLGFGRPMGHNKQAVALTDYSDAGLTFRRFRVRLSVIPRDRERENPSVAELMESARPAYASAIPLGFVPADGAGVILQGFAISTASRAPEGICLAGLDLATSLKEGGMLAVQSTIIGGICNDFDTRGPTLRHGRVTRPEGGVEVTLDIAIVEGGASQTWSGATWDTMLPGPRLANGTTPATEYARDPRKVTTDEAARSHLQCGVFLNGSGYQALPHGDDSIPLDWLSLGTRTEGIPAAAASLSGFSFVLDPVGFDPGAKRPKLTADQALFRNNYIYRYLVRAFPSAKGPFVEAGISHGIHRLGFGRDNARPSALFARVDLTGFPTLPAQPVYDVVGTDSRSDPNLLPEDGYPRWATAFPVATEPGCAPKW